MEIIWILLFGLVVGAVAKLLMPGDDPGGIIVTALLGVVGSVLGYYLFRAIGIGDGERFGLTSFIGAVLGTMLLLGLYSMIAGRGRARDSHRRTALR